MVAMHTHNQLRLIDRCVLQLHTYLEYIAQLYLWYFRMWVVAVGLEYNNMPTNLPRICFQKGKHLEHCMHICW